MYPTLQRAWQLYRFRRYPLALEETVKFLGQYPESAEAHCLLALIHGKEKREHKAISAAQAAVKYMPDWSYPHYVQALVAYWFNKYPIALRALSEAMRIQPANADYYELLSAIHSDQGHLKTSLSVAEKGLELDAEHVGCLYRRGVALFALNKKQEAEVVFNNILKIDAEHASTQCYLGQFAVMKGNYAEAMPLLRHALRESPDWSMAQEAWKEALRGQYRIYGWLVRFQKHYLGKRLWLTFLILYLIIGPMVFLQYDAKLEVGLPVAIFLGAIFSVVALLGLFLGVIFCLTLLSSILLYWNSDLRKSYDWPSWRYVREELKSDFPYILIPAIVVIVVMMYKVFNKAGR